MRRGFASSALECIQQTGLCLVVSCLLELSQNQRHGNCNFTGENDVLQISSKNLGIFICFVFVVLAYALINIFICTVYMMSIPVYELI